MQQEFIKNKRSDNPKKVISSPADIALQTVKNSGLSERKAVQDQIYKYIWETFSSFVANYPKMSLNGLTLTKPLRHFHDLQRNIHRLLATAFVLVIEPKIKNKNSERFAQIQYYWSDSRHFCCIRFYDTSVVLNFHSSDFYAVTRDGGDTNTNHFHV